MKPPKTKHYHLVITDPDKWQRIKIAAQVKGLSLQQVITGLLNEWLNEIEKEIVERYTNK